MADENEMKTWQTGLFEHFRNFIRFCIGAYFALNGLMASISLIDEVADPCIIFGDTA